MNESKEGIPCTVAVTEDAGMLSQAINAAVWFGEFGSVDDLAEQFAEEMPPDMTVLFACYDNQCYDGSALVLFREWSRLYLVTGGHCSCMGLEDQWSPEEVSVPQLRQMLEGGALYVEDRDAQTALAALIASLP